MVSRQRTRRTTCSGICAPQRWRARRPHGLRGLRRLRKRKRGGKLQPVTITRTAPFRVGTLVAVAPTRITRDQGFMVRTQGDPVPHTHQFYRAHMKGGVSLDLTCAGTFFSTPRAGFKNLDKGRIASTKGAGAVEVQVRGLPAWRLPIDVRKQRVALLIRALGELDGGAKQVLHLTDTAPSALVLAVCKNGNQPLQRLFSRGDLDETVFRSDVLEEALWVFGGDLQSDVYIGWARGFLDEERTKLEAMLSEPSTPRLHGKRVHVGHPRQIVEAFAQAIEDLVERRMVRLMQVARVVVRADVTSFRYPFFVTGRQPSFDMPPPVDGLRSLCQRAGRLAEPVRVLLRHSLRLPFARARPGASAHRRATESQDAGSGPHS